MGFDSHIYNSDIYTAWLECADERDLLKQLLKAQWRRWLTHNPTRLLDVGCGAGAAGLRVMEIAETEGVTLEYTGIDPYANQLEMFRQSLGTRAADLQVGTIESLQTDQRWDVIMAVHSLYYVPKLRTALQKLSEHGETLILVHHGERGINEVHQAFREEVMEGPHIVSTDNDVAGELDELGREYELLTLESSVDVSACAHPLNPVGRNLIRFFLERSDLDEDSFERVSKWFRKRPPRMVHDVGVFFVQT
jgi:SAM-dependent methyltransferase